MTSSLDALFLKFYEALPDGSYRDRETQEVFKPDV
jgi:hypothetical protein